MTPIQPTTTITIDDTVFEVASMSQPVQQMVLYIDDWRQRELDATSELLMIRSALKEIQNTLLTTIQNEQATTAEKSADEPADEPAVPQSPA